MGTDIIPYDPYHPHLGYTLAVTCLAWLSVSLYTRLCLQHRPKQRIALYALAIGLPIYAESVSFLIYQLRPAPDTPLGYVLSHFHAYVLQQIPIDTFLEPLTDPERTDFLTRFARRIAEAYPPLPSGGVLLAFPRLFMVAER